MIKQIIVMRTKYPDGKGGLKKLRSGKLISQGCHACLAVILSMFEFKPMVTLNMIIQTICSFFCCKYINRIKRVFVCKENSALNKWLTNSFTKIVCYVESEEEILELKRKADELGILNRVITDNGMTEFHGVPTITCIGFEPCESEVIDKITGNLKLL